MGAHDYLEKPLSYDGVIEAVSGAIEAKRVSIERGAEATLELARDHTEHNRRLVPPPHLHLLEETEACQRTIKESCQKDERE